MRDQAIGATTGDPADGRLLRLGLVGFWHVHARDYALTAARDAATEVVAAWDSDPELAAEGARELGLPLVDDLDALLARDDIDGVIVTTATSAHPDVICRALRAGKHVFTEKLLAADPGDCTALVEEARSRGLALVVSLPRRDDALAATVVRLVGEGALGRVTYVRVRMAHDGWIAGWLPERFADREAAVGGALTDLGCHPVYLVQRLLGARPRSVSATYGTVSGHAVEDNAVVVAGYPDGALGVAEASFVTTPGAFALEVRGTEASVLYGLGREELTAKGGRFGDTWSEVPLDRPGIEPFALWTQAIAGTADATENQRAAIELTRLVATANEAARTGAAVTFHHDEEQEQ